MDNEITFVLNRNRTHKYILIATYLLLTYTNLFNNIDLGVYTKTGYTVAIVLLLSSVFRLFYESFNNYAPLLLIDVRINDNAYISGFFGVATSVLNAGFKMLYTTAVLGFTSNYIYVPDINNRLILIAFSIISVAGYFQHVRHERDNGLEVSTDSLISFIFRR